MYVSINVALGALLLFSCFAWAQETPFQPQAASRSAHITLDAPIEKVFPLFGPVEEKKWAEGWEPEVLYPQDGQPIEGMVFRVSAHGGPSLWTIAHLDLDKHAIQYVVMTPGTRVVTIKVACRAAGDGKTEAEVTYRAVALSPAGAGYLQRLSEEHYTREMQDWEHSINYYLRTGKMAHHD